MEEIVKSDAAEIKPDAPDEIKFDAGAEIELGLRLESGDRSVVVRFPTDAELAERQRRRPVLIRNQGRGVTEQVPAEPGEPDLALFSKIALNGKPSVTKEEAYQIAEILTSISVLGVEVEGDRAAVTMHVMTGLTVRHSLDVPTAGRVVIFRRAAFKMSTQPYGVQQIRLNAEAGARLWDECHGRTEDYAGAVPAIHKDAAARAVVEFIDHHLGLQKNDASF
jgi:hypothetical protein